MTADSNRTNRVVVPSRTAGSQTITLAFPAGLERYRITAEPALRDLVEAELAEPAPRLRVADHLIELAYPVGARARQRAGYSAVRLSTQATWALQATEVAHLELDLSATQLAGLEFDAVAHATLTLPNPVGEVMVTLGAASDVVLTRPDAVPVRVRIRRGVVQLRLDDRFRGAAGTGVDDQTPGWQSARDRYLVHVLGGVRALSVRCADGHHYAMPRTGDRPASDH